MAKDFLEILNNFLMFCSPAVQYLLKTIRLALPHEAFTPNDKIFVIEAIF